MLAIEFTPTGMVLDIQNDWVTFNKKCFDVVLILEKVIVCIKIFLYPFLNSQVWGTLTEA